LNTAIARKRLEEIRDELDRSINVLDRAQQQNGASEEYPQDPADAGANLSETERAAAVLAVARSQRGEVLDALRRIDAGTYGTCADCGGGVPQGRLDAKPEAARCVVCQSKRDRLRR
jgi:DnaK suppressor protein